MATSAPPPESNRTATEQVITVDATRLRLNLGVLTGVGIARQPTLKVLLRAVTLAGETFGHCEAAVTVGGGWGAGPEVCTSQVAYRLDQAQYRSRAGPGVEAAASARPVKVDAIEGCPWPEYREVATEQGVHSSLSLPLVVGGAVAGMLNLYSRHRMAFVGCELAAEAFAAAVAAALEPRLV